MSRMSNSLASSRLTSARTRLNVEFSAEVHRRTLEPDNLIHPRSDEVELALPSLSAAIASEAGALAGLGEEQGGAAEVETRISDALDLDLQAWLGEAGSSKRHAGLARVLKAWNRKSAAPRASLLLEVLALLFDSRTWRTALEDVGPRPSVAVSLVVPYSHAHVTRTGPPRDIDVVIRYRGASRAGGEIEDLAQAMTPTVEVPTPPVVLQARRNAEARAMLLSEFGALTAAEVAELAGSEAKNTSALAGRWRREGRLVTVEHHGRTYYPGFQFDAEAKPRAVVAEVLQHLNAPSMTAWQQALWFTTANGWLGGRRPVDLLDDEPEAVVTAARDALREPVG
jgi:hypothetical protein